MGRTGFCGFQRFPAVFCGDLRKMQASKFRTFFGSFARLSYHVSYWIQCFFGGGGCSADVPP